MKRFLILSLVLGVGVVVFDGVPSTAEAGDGQGAAECATMNGDVNADDTLSISDAVSILGNLFLREPPKLTPLCEIQGSPSLPDTGQLNSVGDCAERPCAAIARIGPFLSCDPSRLTRPWGVLR